MKMSDLTTFDMEYTQVCQALQRLHNEKQIAFGIDLLSDGEDPNGDGEFDEDESAPYVSVGIGRESFNAELRPILTSYFESRKKELEQIFFEHNVTASWHDFQDGKANAS